MQHITDRHFDAERALYNLRNATVSRCRFGGLAMTHDYLIARVMTALL